jgi:hypothetical protein
MRYGFVRVRQIAKWRWVMRAELTPSRGTEAGDDEVVPVR